MNGIIFDYIYIISEKAVEKKTTNKTISEVVEGRNNSTEGLGCNRDRYLAYFSSLMQHCISNPHTKKTS